ncbi:MAG: hypothetical protein AB9842_11340 [Bacteroidales bacterium]
MASKREKIGLILLGIFLGLVVSASFLWWQKHLLKKDWFSFKGIRSAYEKLFDSESDVLAQKKNQSDAGRKNYNLKEPYLYTDTLDARLDSLLLNDSSDLSYLFENSAFEYYIESGNQQDTSYHQPKTYQAYSNPRDTSDSDSLSSAAKKHQSEFIVKRDQFLNTRTYTVAGYPDSLQRQNNRLDSLLTNDVRTKRLSPNTLRVEFWKSPVNYTGYKLSANRLILFGSFIPDEISLEYHNPKLYLKYRNNYYVLETSSDFQNLVTVKRP